MSGELPRSPGLCFEVCPAFVSDPLPRLGDTVRLQVRIRAGAAEVRVYARIREDGERVQRELQEIRSDRGSSDVRCFATELELRERRTCLHFVVTQRDELFFFGRSGASTVPPAPGSDYVIVSDLGLPRSIVSAPLYHVFVDRFARGSTEPPAASRPERILRRWHERPLSFAEASCQDFFAGDLDGVRAHLPHLRELGVGGVCLSPVFDALSNHRYDTVDFANVDPWLGGNEALGQLSEALHEMGMRLILDLTTNHTSSRHPWFVQALRGGDAEERRAYCFDRRASGGYAGWGGLAQYPKLSYESPLTRERMYAGPASPLQTYLKPPYCVDGWRFDAAHQTGNYRERQLGPEVFREMRAVAKGLNPDCYLVGESPTDASAHLQGDEWDAATNYAGCARPLRWFVGELDFCLLGLAERAKVRARTGLELAHQLEQHWRALPSQMVFWQYNFIDCHDAPRFHNTALFSRERLRALLVLLYALPGIPVVYYGSEVGLSGGVDAPEDFRHAMTWQTGEWNRDIHAWYVQLGELRRTESVLQLGAYKVLAADQHSLALARFDQRRAIVAAATNSSQGAVVDVDVSPLAANASGARLLFGGARLEQTESGYEVALAAHGSCLFSLDLAA